MLKKIALLEKSYSIEEREQMFQSLQGKYLATHDDTLRDEIWLLMASAVKNAILKNCSITGYFYDSEELSILVSEGTFFFWKYTLENNKPIRAKLSGYAPFIAKKVMYPNKKIFTVRDEIDFDRCLSHESEEEEEPTYITVKDTNIMIKDRTAIFDGWEIEIEKNGNVLVNSKHKHKQGFDFVASIIYYLANILNEEYLIFSGLEAKRNYEPLLKHFVKKYIKDYFLIDENTYAVKVLFKR